MAELVQHLVVFHFPRELSPEDEREFGRIRQLPEAIGGVRELRIGRDASGR